MGLKYILEKFAQKTGVPCVDYNGIVADAEQRNYALGFINEGAEELYDAADHVGSMEELLISLNPTTQLTVPSYVGKLRALREYNTYIPWKISTLRPRYHYNSWPDECYRNLRDKGVISTARNILNFSPPHAVVTQIENPPIEITIIGATVNAGRISETVVMDSLSKMFTQAFTDYEVIGKNRTNLCDVIIRDADGLELAMIYNYELVSSYRLIDLSEYNISQQGADLTFEILYKKKFKPFINDGDEFQIANFDNPVINKAVQLFAEDKGDLSKAALYDAKAQRTSERKSMDDLKGKDLRIEFMPHKHNRMGKSKFYYR